MIKKLFFSEKKFRWQWKSLIILMSFFLLSGFGEILLPRLFKFIFRNENYNLFDTLSNLIVSALLIGLFCLIKRAGPKSMGLSNMFSTNNQRNLWIGTGVGIICITLLAGILLLTKDLKIISVQLPKTIWEYLLFFISVSLLEEVTTRGALQHMLLESKNIWIATLLPSVFFGLIHIGNQSVTALAIINTILVGVVLAMITHRTKSLYFALGFHFAWNFFLSIIFGMSVSGNDFKGHVVLNTQLVHSSIFNGGNYGVEGGIYCTILMLGILIYLFYTSPKRVSIENK